jgi:glycogen phosphorylase
MIAQPAFEESSRMPRVPHVAFLCMEYGLAESFPIYSGGLGILAGDFIKSARDLGRPVVAVGLRWDRGYCVQRIGKNGEPFEEFPAYDHSFLRDTRVRVRVRVRGKEVPCMVWVTERHGHVPLHLIEPLRAEDRWITHRLYEAGSDVRIAQEMLLGIGGLRALNWLGIPISAYHFNEGHAVFAGVEMIAERMEAGMSFEEAWSDARRRIVFTTHTPVRAGNEEHSLDDLRRLGATLQLSPAEMKALGGDPFSMTVAGLRLARAANAVSELHGRTARAMWAHVPDAAPIGSITNGVHAPTWQSESVRAARRDPAALWAAHAGHREELGQAVRRATGITLDPAGPWIGFARRAAKYKRGDLILRDPGLLAKLLRDSRAVFLMSGKSHPDDLQGKAILARLAQAGGTYPGRIVFLENYDMALARLLTRGCDVWLNTPILPLEACGTSGMKAALNGVVNLSIPDGWWAEAVQHGVNGWSIGDGSPSDDERDLTTLFDLLEREVLPAWADRERWRKLMLASLTMAEDRFTSHRMVNEYFETLYTETPVPAAARA